jgi:hypothetical protein
MGIGSEIEPRQTTFDAGQRDLLDGIEADGAEEESPRLIV